MFDILDKFYSSGHFFFSEKNDLRKVCNAPKAGLGVYLIYALKNGKVELVYIGSSGKVNQNGIKKPRKGGLFDQLVNGKQFGQARKKSWKERLRSEKIDALDIYWYETIDDIHFAIPKFIEGHLLQSFLDIHGHLPSWNKEF